VTVRCVAVPFEHLDPDSLYAIVKLRQDVFIIEQQSVYPDLDGRDAEPGTRHVLLTVDDGFAGYARVLDDGDAWRIGRVAVHPTMRGQGLAGVLMENALLVARGRPIVLDAQTGLVRWYAGYGFEVSGPEFLDGGVPHQPMRRD